MFKAFKIKTIASSAFIFPVPDPSHKIYSTEILLLLLLCGLFPKNIISYIASVTIWLYLFFSYL